MTYRRLFIFLCLAGLLALAGMWWMSLRYDFYMMIGPPRGHSTMTFGLSFGGIGIDFEPDSLYGMSDRWVGIFGGPIDRGLIIREHGLLGDLDWGKKSFGGDPGWKERYSYYVKSPLWLVYVAFIVVVYLALRRPMRKQRLLEKM